METIDSPRAPTPRLTYGQAQAVKILAAERMGLNPSCLNFAESMMRGAPLHVMHAAALESEASRINSLFAGDHRQVAQANAEGAKVLAEYGIAHIVPAAAQTALV